MKTKIPLTGTYVKQPDGYFSQTDSHRLIIGHRNQKNGKTTEFLILKPCCGVDTLPDGTRERYVSGIFWVTDTTGRIDFEGKRYTVTVTSDNLIIEGGGKGV